MFGALGVPDPIRGFLFDLDGVLTQTAKQHAAAWKLMFDEFLAQRAREGGEPFVPFDSGADYDTYVDGKPRLAGTQAFLASRHIELPTGTPQDPPGAPTVHGLSNRKNDLVLELIRTQGVTVYPGSVRYLRAARDAGLPCAVVTSSANAAQVLTSAGLSELFDARVDGLVALREGLAGKPAPDTFLAGARLLGVPPGAAVVFEDALAGVAAGRAGQFGYVVGVDRVGQADALRAHGADVVVGDLAELLDQS
ncbi:MAG TPA: beta-phosphoglucomutase family hydrolase [Mycobacterium sp.]|jgi:beta-phosphoglucomutase family hydrolase|nr:beta-phosphoglucomutase family hydrolase [Mycobacterium sp.]HWR47506.1 beta-phosphoglucomutase family hydrolase [Pseudonocardiaceae bacterium]